MLTLISSALPALTSASSIKHLILDFVAALTSPVFPGDFFSGENSTTETFFICPEEGLEVGETEEPFFSGSDAILSGPSVEEW